MATLIIDRELEKRLIARRRARGIDQHDEVWKGVYVMTPLANNEHQRIIWGLVRALDEAIGDAGLGEGFPGINLAASAENWRHDFRVPDVVAFVPGTAARNYDTFWVGAADFVVEIVTPGDRTRKKLRFYSRLGVREVLVVDRRPWRLTLYRQQEGRLRKVGVTTPERGEPLRSGVFPMQFRLVAGEPRPKIEITSTVDGRRWAV